MSEVNHNNRVLSDRMIIKRSLQYIKPHRKDFLFALLLMVLVIALELSGPYLSSLVIGKLAHPENTTYIVVLSLSLGYLASVLSSLLFMYFETMILQKAGQEIVFQLRQDIFQHIESLAISQINDVPIGKLVSRVTSDTNAVNELYTNILVNLLKNILSLFGVFGMMLVLNAWLSLWMLIFVPIVGVISFVFRYLSRKAYRDVRHRITDMNAFLNENLSGMTITQVFNQEDRKAHEFTDVNQKLLKARSRQNIIFSVFRPLISLLYMIAIACLVYVGAYRLKLGENLDGIQVIWAFYEYVGRFFGPIQTLADQVNGLQQAFAASERLFLLLDLKPDLQDEESAIELPPIKGEIVFDHVWFAYKENEWILKDVSFRVEPQQSLALVGATGAGKTTILSLLTRNYEIQKGAIYIDGIDIRRVSLSSLRKQIGQMLQDVFLFGGTIKDNISMRDETMSDEEIIAASKYVGADTFINKLKDGYNEQVLERGANFSSGERQLLSFARTIAHHPRLLILDEATANIDTETEVIIQESLAKMMSVNTMLIVAHRLSTIQHADCIIVLQNGEIIEKGTHQDLLQKKGYYYNLYRLQFEEKIIERR